MTKPTDIKPPDLLFGDYVRRAHAQHYDHCEATGSWSGIYTTAFYRALERHLVKAINPLFSRIDAETAGIDRLALRRTLECRQDYNTDELVTLFLQVLAEHAAGPPAFGHLAEGRMGVTDTQLWWQQLTLFREAILDELLATV